MLARGEECIEGVIHRLGVTYSTSSDHPIAVVGVQIAEAIDNANEANEANKDPDSVFISGNSRPCLIDIRNRSSDEGVEQRELLCEPDDHELVQHDGRRAAVAAD